VYLSLITGVFKRKIPSLCPKLIAFKKIDEYSPTEEIGGDVRRKLSLPIANRCIKEEMRGEKCRKREHTIVGGY
jgi:hypothetical protein